MIKFALSLGMMLAIYIFYNMVSKGVFGNPLTAELAYITFFTFLLVLIGMQMINELYYQRQLIDYYRLQLQIHDITNPHRNNRQQQGRTRNPAPPSPVQINDEYVIETLSTMPTRPNSDEEILTANQLEAIRSTVRLPRAGNNNRPG